tara:strand:+ start:10606 stop:10884 length:279 start_codon:yes stop_codon:yes gene_type:complete
MNLPFINLDKNICALFLSNQNNLLINFCLKNSKDFKIINYKKKKEEFSNFFSNNTTVIITTISLLKKKYLNLLLQTELKKIEIFGILYDNKL